MKKTLLALALLSVISVPAMADEYLTVINHTPFPINLAPCANQANSVLLPPNLEFPTQVQLSDYSLHESCSIESNPLIDMTISNGSYGNGAINLSLNPPMDFSFLGATFNNPLFKYTVTGSHNNILNIFYLGNNKGVK